MTTWAPEPGAVKAIIAARLDGADFSADTTPNLDDVALTIGQVTTEVVAAVPPFSALTVVNPDEPVADQVTLGQIAARAVALGAAHEVERALFPEQQEQTETEGNLYRQYLAQIERLRSAIASTRATADGRVLTGSLETPLAGVRSAAWLDVESRAIP